MSPIHYGLAITSATTAEPVPTSDFKDWLRLSSTETAEDTLVEAIVKASRKRIEEYTGRSCMKQTYTWTLDTLPASSTQPLVFPVSPLVSITSITTYDDDDTASVWSTSEYRVDTASEPGRVVPKDDYDWPDDLRNHQAAVIVFVAGYTSDRSTSLPEELAIAIKALGAYHYEHRGDEVPTHPTEWDYAMGLPQHVAMMLQDYMLPDYG